MLEQACKKHHKPTKYLIKMNWKTKVVHFCRIHYYTTENVFSANSIWYVGCNSYIKYYEQKEEKNDPTEIRTKT